MTPLDIIRQLEDIGMRIYISDKIKITDLSLRPRFFENWNEVYEHYKKVLK